LIVAHAARRTRPGLIQQTIKPPLKESAAPFADRLLCDVQPFGDIFVGRSGCAPQHDSSPQCQCLR
jgi:hypothetical protein